MNGSILDPVFKYYSQCGSLCALYELEIRLIAGRTKELEHLAYKRLSEIEEPFLAHFDSYLTAEEKNLLSKAKKIRDKLLHADFKGLIDKVKEISPDKVKDSPVGMVKLDTQQTTMVSDTTKRQGGVFGWLLQSAQDGSLHEAGQLLNSAYQVVHRIAVQSASPSS